MTTSDKTQSYSKIAKNALNNVSDRLHEDYSELESKAYDLQDNLATYVKKNPIKSLAWAALTGIIVSKIFL